jgi:hypothetical protein
METAAGKTDRSLPFFTALHFKSIAQATTHLSFTPLLRASCISHPQVPGLRATFRRPDLLIARINPCHRFCIRE